MAVKDDIKVASATSIKAAESTSIGDIAAVTGLAAQAGEGLAVAEAERDAGVLLDTVTQEINTILSGQEQSASNEMSSRAKRIKALHKQGRLTDTAVQIELEHELKSMSRKWGGLFGDSIYKAAVNEMGFDPKNAQFRFAMEELEAARGRQPQTLRQQLVGNGVAGEDVPHVVARAQEVGVEVAAAEYFKDVSDQRRHELAANALKGNETNTAQVSLNMQDMAATMINRSLREKNPLINSIQEKLRTNSIDINEATSTLSDVKQVMRSQVIARFKELNPDVKLNNSVLEDLNKTIDNGYKYIMENIEASDGLKQQEYKLSMQQATADSAVNGRAPILTAIKRSLGDQIAGIAMTNPKIFQSLYPGIHKLMYDDSGTRLTHNQQQSVIGYLSAVASGDMELANAVRSTDPSVVALAETQMAAKGTNAHEIVENVIKPSALAANVADMRRSPNDRVADVQALGATNRDKLLSLLKTPASFNGIAGSPEVAGVVRDAVKAKISSYTLKLRQQPVKFPSGDFYEEDSPRSFGSPRVSYEWLDMSTADMISAGLIEVSTVVNDVELGTFTQGVAIPRESLVITDKYRELLENVPNGVSVATKQLEEVDTGDLDIMTRLLENASKSGLSHLTGIKDRGMLNRVLISTIPTESRLPEATPVAGTPTDSAVIGNSGEGSSSQPMTPEERRSKVQEIYNRLRGNSDGQ